MNTHTATRQLDAYGFPFAAVTELETIEEQQYRIARRNRRRLARLEAEAAALRANGLYHAEIVGAHNPASAYVRCFLRPNALADLFVSALAGLVVSE